MGEAAHDEDLLVADVTNATNTTDATDATDATDRRQDERFRQPRPVHVFAPSETCFRHTPAAHTGSPKGIRHIP
ncbi:hypothetical protein ACGFZP_36295 [Kitasatospora sp. NPDC048239]|uniref:hypothetical protein n=1 Tax=Kitasatospora sp. NPDC048239 TaxID=3364046 RepID=UPI00370F9C97